MAISGDYPTPVTVNGYQCNNCTDVDNAKKFIDPAHPKSGPFGINAKTDPTQNPSSLDAAPAVTYGGLLAKFNAPQSTTTTGSGGAGSNPAGTITAGAAAAGSSAGRSGLGGQLDLSV